MKKKLLDPSGSRPGQCSRTLPYTVMMLLLVVSLNAFQIQAADTVRKGEAISLNFENTPLREVFDAIERKTRYRFFYNTRFLDGSQKVSVKSEGVSIETAIAALLKDLPGVTFKIKDDQIIIKKVYDAEKNTNRGAEDPQPGERTSTSDDDNIQTSAAASAVEYELTVRGVVRSETGEPMPGVNVIVKGTRAGTATDADGQYTITVNDGSETLIFSFIGYQTVEVNIVGRTQIDVTIEPDIRSLEEIVVVGYGIVKKSDLTGSVSSVKAEDFNKGVNTSVAQLIQGKVAGARIVTNSGDPGAGLSVSIRGASSVNAGTEPLYVIDGLPIETSNAYTGTGDGIPSTNSPRSPLNVLNPSDIESIEVLKDASATAIYGARAANGVILITTKQGKEGKVKVSYESYVGIQNSVSKMDMLSPSEYKQVVNDIISEGGGSTEEIVGEITGGGTDWQEEVRNKNAIVQNHTISFKGGSKTSRYFASFNYMDQEGVIISSRFKKYGTRFNIDSEVSDKFRFGLNLNAAYTQDDFVPEGYAINENGGVLYGAIFYDPTLPVKDDNGDYNVSTILTLENPLALANGVDSYANNYSIMGTTFGEYKITPSLSARINVGGNILSQRRDTYVGRLTQKGASNGGIATIRQGQNSNYLIEATATYKKQIGVHDFNLLAGATTQKYTTVRSYQSAKNFASDVTGTDNIGLGDIETYEMGSDKFNNKLISYIFRANYLLADKYLLTATFRADGSSKFGKNNKFGYFPSFAGAWKISQEEFMNTVGWLDELKLRGSWGRTGNQAINNYQSISTFSAGATTVLDQQEVTSLSPERIGNPDLKWETTEQWNIGLDVGLFTDRISASVDFFRKKTFDMLLNLPISLSTGFSSIMTNAGEIDNHGIDISLNTVNVRKKDFSWETSLTLFTVKNKVTDLGGISQIITGSAGFTDEIFVIEEGVPLRSFYGYKIDGIWQQDDDLSVTTDNVSPGDIKYHDQTGDKAVTSEDRVILGDGFPDFSYSISNNFTYKNLSLNVFIEGVQGVEMLNNNLVDTYFPIQLRRNKLSDPYLNRWTAENPSTRYPSFVNTSGQGRRPVNSYTIEDASYIRLKTVRLSYTLPERFVHPRLEGVMLYVAGENLLTLTDYSGIDPAVNSNGTANTNIDFNTYPLSRTFIVGLKIDF